MKKYLALLCLATFLLSCSKDEFIETGGGELTVFDYLPAPGLFIN